MRCTPNLLVPVMAVLACVAASAQMPTFSLGRTPSKEEIRAWDIAIGPDGKELPAGRGTAKEGAKIYEQKCAVCHEPTVTGVRFGPPLAASKGTNNTLQPVRTPGSFWPFATTIWDYINRAMPLKKEGTLSANEVYALTAFLLFKNDIIREDDVLDAQSLPKVKMPNRDGYVPPPEWKPGMPRPFTITPEP